ncbi:MAG: anaerobic magnesium-protoporphyrin IX monomethyl ester cyclase [Candidatus Paceibacteria bacterium]|jgi:anaerobic magnesium-protoporphyrin IX monomethyl ester cyclase
MARAGCHTVIMGVESADDELLKIYRKGYSSSSIAGAFERASRAGLRTVGTFIIGLPEETRASLDSTLELAKALELDFMSLNMAVPRFGTEFRTRAIESGMTDSDELVMDQGGRQAALETSSLSRESMLAIKKRMVRRFYLRPSYLWRRLRGVRNFPELCRQAREGLTLLSRNV